MNENIIEKNPNKVDVIKIEDGRIVSIKICTSNLDNYTNLSGCRKIGNSNEFEFYTEEAIYIALKNIGFNHNIDLNLKNNDFKTYLELSKFLNEHYGFLIDSNLYCFPSDRLSRIKKLTLNEDLSISNVELYIGESLKDFYDTAILDYSTYIFMFALSGEILEEKKVEDILKSNHLAEHYNGFKYNHYSQLESDGYSIVKKIITNDNHIFEGVFRVNTQDILLKFEVIEKGISSINKQDILIGTVFYISNNNIAYME